MLFLLIVLILIFGLGGHFYDNGAYRGQGFSLGGILVVVLIVLFLMHRL